MTQRMQTVRRGVGVPRPRITEPNTALTAGASRTPQQCCKADCMHHTLLWRWMLRARCAQTTSFLLPDFEIDTFCLTNIACGTDRVPG